MATSNTPKAALPYPENSERVADVPDHVKALALALDGKVIGVYANQTALTGAGTPSTGQVAYITDSGVLQVYSGSSWKRIYPASPTIFSGTTVPASTLGASGDIYVQY